MSKKTSVLAINKPEIEKWMEGTNREGKLAKVPIWEDLHIVDVLQDPKDVVPSIENNNPNMVFLSNLLDNIDSLKMTLKRCKQSYPHVRIIMLLWESSKNSQELLHFCLHHNITNDFVMKVTTNNIKKIVDTPMDNEQALALKDPEFVYTPEADNSQVQVVQAPEPRKSFFPRRQSASETNKPQGKEKIAFSALTNALKRDPKKSDKALPPKIEIGSDDTPASKIDTDIPKPEHKVKDNTKPLETEGMPPKTSIPVTETPAQHVSANSDNVPVHKPVDAVIPDIPEKRDPEAKEYQEEAHAHVERTRSEIDSADMLYARDTYQHVTEKSSIGVANSGEHRLDEPTKVPVAEPKTAETEVQQKIVAPVKNTLPEKPIVKKVEPAKETLTPTPEELHKMRPVMEITPTPSTKPSVVLGEFDVDASSAPLSKPEKKLPGSILNVFGKNKNVMQVDTETQNVGLADMERPIQQAPVAPPAYHPELAHPSRHSNTALHAPQFINAKVITCYSPNSIGKTTVLSNMAVVAAQMGINPIAIDMNVVKHDLGAYFNIPRKTLGLEQLIYDGVDETTIRALIQQRQGVDILPIGMERARYDLSIDPEQVNQIINIVSRRMNYSMILVDTCNIIDEAATATMLAQSDIIYLVVDQNRSFLEDIYNELIFAEEVMKIPRSKFRLIINNYIPKVDMSQTRIENYLKMKAVSVIPSDRYGHLQAVNYGKPYCTSKNDDSEIWSSLIENAVGRSLGEKQGMFGKLSKLFSK